MGQIFSWIRGTRDQPALQDIAVEQQVSLTGYYHIEVSESTVCAWVCLVLCLRCSDLTWQCKDWSWAFKWEFLFSALVRRSWLWSHSNRPREEECWNVWGVLGMFYKSGTIGTFSTLIKLQLYQGLFSLRYLFYWECYDTSRCSNVQ